MMRVYTLKNCDTCKKALKWMTAEGIAFENHDIRADGTDATWVTSIVDAVGWEIALNRRSTTWRSLDETDKEEITNAKAISLIVKHPTLLKRPAFVHRGKVIFGFDVKSHSAIKSLA